MFKYHDLREYVGAVEKMGELSTIKGINWDIELGELTDVLAHQLNTPMVMFDEIKGYPPGFRVLVNFTGSYNRLALLLGLDKVEMGVPLVRTWREMRSKRRLVPPVTVGGSPVQECIREGKDINLFELPVPKWHAHDGGRYIGTSSSGW